MTAGEDKRRKLSDQQRADIVRLRGNGWIYKDLAMHFDVSEYTIRVVLDPSLARTRYRNAVKRRSSDGPDPSRGSLARPPQSSVDKDARTKAIQPPTRDERDLTGRVCGDPFPGRSALDKRRAQQ